MSLYQQEPEIEIEKQNDIVILHLKGDFVLYMPNEWRNKVFNYFCELDKYDYLIMDLSAIKMFSSWGVIQIKFCISQHVEKEAYIVIDNSRCAEFEGLKINLSTLDQKIYFVNDINSSLKTIKATKGESE